MSLTFHFVKRKCCVAGKILWWAWLVSSGRLGARKLRKLSPVGSNAIEGELEAKKDKNR